jgi:hypothetical protein
MMEQQQMILRVKKEHYLWVKTISLSKVTPMLHRSQNGSNKPIKVSKALKLELL